MPAQIKTLFVVRMAAEDATIEACNLFSQLAISKTTTIEEVVSKNYGSWRALLTLMKEIRQDDTSEFSKLDLERIANLSVGFHQWGTRQLKERSPMFSDEFKRFVSNRLIVESLMEDLMGSARSKGGDENNDEMSTMVLGVNSPRRRRAVARRRRRLCRPAFGRNN